MSSTLSKLIFLESAVEELETFLLSDQIFWRIWNGKRRGAPAQSLSLGMLRLQLNELRARSTELDPEGKARWDTLRSEVLEIQNRWRVAWEKKAAAELPHRLNLWRAYLQDLIDRIRLPESYPREVQNRISLTFLLDEAGGHSPGIQFTNQVSTLDSKLRSISRKGSFVWDPVLQTSYSEDRFWYLYLELREINQG